MLCVQSPLMFAYYSSAFGNNALQFGHLLFETVMIEFTVMWFVCFIQAAEYAMADFFISARFLALTDDGQLCANERVLVLLPSDMRPTS